MIGPEYDIDLGLLYWGQDDHQAQASMNPSLGQGTLLNSVYWADVFPPTTWSTDGSLATECFAQDVDMAFEYPEILPADPSQLETNMLYGQVSSDDNSSDTSLQPSSALTAEGVDAETISLLSLGDKSPLGCSPRATTAPRAALTSSSAQHHANRRTRPARSTDTVLRARESHNMVEKQYRNRLKMQFEKLLAVLPMRSPNDDYDDVDAIAPDHGFSRGEVLDAARRRILSLEMENQQLAVARDQLMKDIFLPQFLRPSASGAKAPLTQKGKTSTEGLSPISRFLVALSFDTRCFHPKLAKSIN